MRSYDISDDAGQQLLQLGCAALDRAERCKAQINDEGEVIETKSGPRDHPLLRHVAIARAFTAKMLMALRINTAPARPVGRPPSRGY